jgi:polar amino acid transport system substrate-binding protein
MKELGLRYLAILTALAILIAGCDGFPRDSHRTLERVRAGEPLRVGWVKVEPWVQVDSAGEPAGIEPELIRAWAASLPARVEWIYGSEAQLAEALQGNALHIAVAGFAADTPWGGQIGQTQPYAETETVIGIAPGISAPASWHGAEIRYDCRRPQFAALISETGAKPICEDRGRLAPIAAVYAEELSGLGLRPTGTALGKEQRTIATAPAENALTLALDRFLHSREQAIKGRLASVALP